MTQDRKTLDFIFRARQIHGDKYDYSKVEYINNATKVCIICKKCGMEFWMKPINHIYNKQGCPRCAVEHVHEQLRKTTEDFIIESKAVHGDKYIYTESEYINNTTEVCIICPEHGKFWMTPVNHINKGCGCPKCNKYSKRYTQETIIDAFREIHGDKYDYSKVVFKTVHDKVCVVCFEHGEFWVTPDNHLRGRGCPECKKEKIRSKLQITNDEFIRRAREVHGDTYIYLGKYKNLNEPIEITCKIHGVFWQRPYVHLKGCGCPKCATISIAENEIEKILNDNNISYVKQQTWDWLKYKHPLQLDFYLPDYNVAIECQGIQHFKPVELFGGEKQFEIQQKLDETKRKLCEENNVTLLFYANFDYDFPYEVINNKEKLLNELKKYGKDNKNI